MNVPRLILSFLVLMLLVSVPVGAQAADTSFFGPIIPETCNCDDVTPPSAPGWGCVLQVVQNLLNFAISLGIIIAVLVMAYAGLLWIMSPMSAQNKEMGRTMLLNAVIGLVIALAAWLIVDFVMKSLYNPNAGFGAWNDILEEGSACIPKAQNPTNWLGLDVTALGSGVVNQATGGAAGGGGAAPTPSDNTWDWNAGIQAQYTAHASDALKSLMTCMLPKVPGNAGRVSSISDNLIMSGSKTWTQCRAGQCQHCGGTGANKCASGGASYHYGGTTCGDRSHGVDFGDENNANDLISAAGQCGGRGALEGDHVHVQVGSCN